MHSLALAHADLLTRRLNASDNQLQAVHVVTYSFGIVVNKAVTFEQRLLSMSNIVVPSHCPRLGFRGRPASW